MPVGRGNVLCPTIAALALTSRPAAAVTGVAGAMAAAEAWRDGRGAWTSTGWEIAAGAVAAASAASVRTELHGWPVISSA
eukprot:207198-Chlamydomonas_euryale.AAC.1